MPAGVEVKLRRGKGDLTRAAPTRCSQAIAAAGLTPGRAAAGRSAESPKASTSALLPFAAAHLSGSWLFFHWFVGFVPLKDLGGMFIALKERFLDRNIRSLLSGKKPGKETGVNRRLLRAFEEVVLTQKTEPSTFAFNHNGVTVFAELMEGSNGKYRVTEPRLLNGAQTVGSFDAFVKGHRDNPLPSI